MHHGRRPVTAYTVAVVSVGLGIALPLVSKPFVGQSAPYVSYIPAVVLSAWYGGFVPGLVTTGMLLVSTVVLNDLLFTSTSKPGARIFAGFMFSVASLAVCLAIRAMRLAQAEAMEAAISAKAAEARAQEERDRLDAIVRDLPVGVLIATHDQRTPRAPSRVELANPAASSILGETVRTGDDIYTHRPESFRNAQGQELGTGHWPIERSLLNGETLFNEEIDIVRPDGMQRTVMINSRPLQGTAGQSSAIATYSDVTSLRAAQKALQASEARLRRLFDSPIIGVISGDQDTVTEANDGFLRMLGYTREDLRAGALCTSTLSPAEYQPTDERILGQLRERGFSDPVAREMVAVDGRRVPVMVGVTTFEAGQTSPWIAWVLDLSEHRRLEERLRQAAKAESVGLLAAGVAHDFNNLLTIIMGNVALTHDMLGRNDPAKPQLDKALRAADRAADLTRQLLAYAGKGQFIVEDADVSRVIGDISRLFRSSAGKDVRIDLELEEGLPLVNMDATQIQQLTMNLVINAVEACGDGAGEVSVTTSMVEVDERTGRAAESVQELRPGRYVSIEVADSGCGMDAETRSHIFDPFFTTKLAGRGLGLAAAAGIVRAHRGGFLVQSAPGEGSVFQVLLPAVAVTADKVDPERVPALSGVEAV